MDSIDTIICKNNIKDVIENIRNRISKDSVKDIYLVDSSNDEIVLLISGERITKQVAEAFWLGYKKALE